MVSKNLFLLIAVGIIAVFGLLLIGFKIYNPVWFKFQESRLCSDDLAVRESAADSIASKGDAAIPYIRVWLGSADNNLVIGACAALEKMDKNHWNDFKYELKNILKRPYSETTKAVVRYASKKDVFKDCRDIFAFSYGNSREFGPKIERNIHMYLLEHERAKAVEMGSAFRLGELCDSAALDVLLRVFLESDDFDIYMYAGKALPKIGSPKLIPIMIKVLNSNPVAFKRSFAAEALGWLRVTAATDALIGAMKTDPSPSVQGDAAIALGVIGNASAIDALAEILFLDDWRRPHGEAVEALGGFDPGMIKNIILKAWMREKIDEPLSEKLFRERLAITSAKIPGDDIDSLLAGAADFNNMAVVALAWRNGGEYLSKTRRFNFTTLDDPYYRRIFQACALARWGNVSAIERVFKNDAYICNPDVLMSYFYADLFNRMPGEFPKIDLKAKYQVLRKQVWAAEACLEKNKNLLGWDTRTRKYCLEPAAPR
jgi:HEAT repeat protein